MNPLARITFARRILSKTLLSGVGLLLAGSAAFAQSTGNGPYYAVPSWDQTLPPSTRFVILSNMRSEAFLDRETGLVWQRQFPSVTQPNWNFASYSCNIAKTGGRRGWRLPSVQELNSLFDESFDLNLVFTGFPQSSNSVPISASTAGTTDDAFPFESHYYFSVTNNPPSSVLGAYLHDIAMYAVCVRGGSGEWRQ